MAGGGSADDSADSLELVRFSNARAHVVPLPRNRKRKAPKVHTYDQEPVMGSCYDIGKNYVFLAAIPKAKTFLKPSERVSLTRTVKVQFQRCTTMCTVGTKRLGTRGVPNSLLLKHTWYQIVVNRLSNGNITFSFVSR